ncbi:hypothetical protein VW29_12695, partial [Devosia limi DSM 17137]
MRVLVRAIALLLLGLLLTLPARAQEQINAFAANLVLATDGTVTVTETIDVLAQGIEIRRGIFRDIPVTMLAPDGGKIRPVLDVLSVRRNGADEPFRLERMGDFQRIWIGSSETLLGRGRQRYELTYTMSRMGRMFDDHDELYWNATGNYWIFPIIKSVATVTLPPGAVIADLVAYTGPLGSTEQAVTITRTSDRTATFRSQRRLGPGEGMTIAVAFNKGVLTGPTGLDAVWQWLSDLRDVIVPLLAVALVLFYNLLAWMSVGRDPAKGVIIPLFHAPKGFSPALTHFVHKWGFANGGWTAFTAAIFDLGVKGLVTIDNSGKALKVSVTGKTPSEPLPPGEQLVLNYFSTRGTTVIDKANGPGLNKRKDEFVAAIQSENRERWFRANTGYAVLGVVLAVVCLGLLVWSDVLDPVWLFLAVIGGVIVALLGTAVTRFWQGSLVSRFITGIVVSIFAFNLVGVALESFSRVQINTAAMAALSIVAITVVFAVLMRAPTIQGRKVMDEIDGFKLYLETAEKERLNMAGEPPMTVERFERILPYAIALGVEKPWSQHFEGELARNAVPDVPEGYRPVWYSGSSFSPGRISESVAAASSGMAAAMVAAQPVQASSSGFSSGGGGGGGGVS